MAVGGVDPSGGAGLAVDRSAIEAAGMLCQTFVTAETDQDDGEVRSLGARPGQLWRDECQQSVQFSAPGAVKFGLLPGRDALLSATALVDFLLGSQPGLPVVLDPVLASSSGFEFLAVGDFPLLLDLCRRPLILTPNLLELAALTGSDPGQLSADLPARLGAAQQLLSLGLRAVVVKDGHGHGKTLCDWLCVGAGFGGGAPQPLRRLRVQTASGGGSIRGTGCRFASHMAAGLGQGHTLSGAAIRAGDWVSEEISKGK
jgi:hydroxymethylpyrimidine/phosphomethylpyrimidine kinase